MARLTRCLIARVCGMLKRERGWVDMNDVERAALVLLADPFSQAGCRSGWTRASSHLLIDEFQDTNPLQWQALHAWLSGYAGRAAARGAAQRVHRGRPQAEHLPLSPCRAAGVQAPRRQFMRDGLGGDLLSLRPHPPQRPGRASAAVNHVMGRRRRRARPVATAPHHRIHRRRPRAAPAAHPAPRPKAGKDAPRWTPLSCPGATA
jgi:ATP-dependent helicase/nuclease subunit A